jgi:hypothetical protein
MEPGQREAKDYREKSRRSVAAGWLSGPSAAAKPGFSVGNGAEALASIALILAMVE